MKNLEQCGAHCRCQISRTQETSFVVKIPSWKRLGARVMSFASLIPLIFHRDRALDPSNNWHMKYPLCNIENNFTKSYYLLRCLPYLFFFAKEFFSRYVLLHSSWNGPSKPCKRGLNFCKCVQVISLFVCFSENGTRIQMLKSLPGLLIVWVGNNEAIQILIFLSRY